MHHGPILTLHDYVIITLEYFLKTKKPTSTFLVAKEILKDHQNNIIQVVMLSKTMHQLVTAKKLIIPLEMAWGSLDNYLYKYQEYVPEEIMNKINDYKRLCDENKLEDNKFIKLNKQVTDWNTKVVELKQKDK